MHAYVSVVSQYRSAHGAQIRLCIEFQSPAQRPFIFRRKGLLACLQMQFFRSIHGWSCLRNCSDQLANLREKLDMVPRNCIGVADGEGRSCARSVQPLLYGDSGHKCKRRWNPPTWGFGLAEHASAHALIVLPHAVVEPHNA